MAEHKHHVQKAPSPMFSLAAKVSKYLSFALRRLWILVPLIALGLGIAFWKTSREEPFYQSNARMMVQGRIALPDGAAYSEESANFAGTQVEMMRSAEVRRRAAARVEAQRPGLRPSRVIVNVSTQRTTSFFILTAIGEEPQYTQAFLDATMQEYIQYKRELRLETADTALTAVTDQLLKLDKELQAGQEELIEFQKKNNVIGLEDEGNSASRYLVGLKHKLVEMRRELELMKLLDVDQVIDRQQQQQKVATVAGEEKPPTDEETGEPQKLAGPEGDYFMAKQQIQVWQAKMEQLSRYLRPKHPKIADLAERIKMQEKLIDLYRQQSTAQLQKRRQWIELEIENFESAAKNYEEKTVQLNQKIAEYNMLKAKTERAKALSDRLQWAIQSVDVNKTLGQDVLTIMEEASPAIATKPGVLKNLLTGGAIGLLLGAVVLVCMALFDDRISSSIEVQEHFDEEILAQLPREKGVGLLNLLKLDDKHHYFAEACKYLRSSLLFMAVEEPRPKTFLVTSAIPNEGKSTVAVNLAISLAASGSNTLLIDADLRKGSVHSYFDAKAEPGFSEVLARQLSWKEALVQTAQENLRFLPRGKTINNASEYFLGKVTDEFLREIYSEFDYIIIDSAPVLAKEDTASLAPKADAALFVIRAGVASLRTSRSALSALHKRNVNVLGIVLNSTKKTGSDSYYYQYGEYYETETPVKSA